MAILNNDRKIVYLKDVFYYDNRFVPIILQGYPKEINDLNEAISLKDIKTVLDIGANIGQFSYTLNKLYPHLKIYSFEPNKDAFKILKKNLSIPEKTFLFNYALGDSTGERTFYYSPDVSAEGSFILENVNQNYVHRDIKKTSIKTIKLDKKNLKTLNIPYSFDLVKIDVEGAELEVLRSLRDVEFKYLEIEISISRQGANLKKVINSIANLKGIKPKLLHYSKLGKKSPVANAIFKI